MNANTVYTFLDFGTTAEFIDTAKAVLDFCYQNGIMVIMTVDENGSDNKANIETAVNAFKNHPAVLMWALGNEWNLEREDRSNFYAHYTTLSEAASAIQENAQLIKSLDQNHPVVSILGEITQPTQAKVSDIVNNICTAVDVWGANIYRGPEFYDLFTQWKAMSTKPLFLSEFGTDAFHSTQWWPVVAGNEDQEMQADYIETLWLDMASEFSADDPMKVCVGGTVFEWNDEWWKTGNGSPSAHEFDGYETTWTPIAHPDGFANEEWFGIVNIDRERRASYLSLQNTFRSRQNGPLSPILFLLSQ
nr:glycoside hydrolase family 2 TIM barrel-domain containing protein [uncultured Desulfobulbus sp.]